ncbi:uncharacterized protein STEHIDRAFT_35770, partial [Stereum hirsutum FP-91666 SS1]|uniref:uncharacterized protein n=1 Tax=Stereum hirsutum (strain FP-91666) TaxID=721885 RepID=UPI000444A5CB
LAYIDDNFGFDEEEGLDLYEPYDAFLPSRQACLLRLWDRIGVPHKAKKQVYGRSLKIIGFQVDIDKMTVSIPPDSRRAHVAHIREFLAQRRQPLVEWQRLLGWCNWALNVVPLLRPALQSSYEKTRGKQVRNAPIFLNNEVRHDLSFFADTLEAWDGVHLLESDSW